MQRASKMNTSAFKKYMCKFPMFVMSGGLSEELLRNGVPDDRRIWTAVALVNETMHSTIEKCHIDFLRAGSQMITTGNYAVIPRLFAHEEINRYVSTAGMLAQNAVKKWMEERPSSERPLVAGCLPPLVESYRPDLVGPTEETIGGYKLIIGSLEPYVDLYLAETLSSPREALCAIDAVASMSEKTLWVSFALAEDGKLRSGEDFGEVIIQLHKSSNGHIVSAFLANCCSPEAIDKALGRMTVEMRMYCQRNEVRLGGYANALPPVGDDFCLEEETEGAKSRSDLGPEVYAEIVKHWLENGVSIVGGCCCIYHEHIRRICHQLRDNSSL